MNMILNVYVHPIIEILIMIVFVILVLQKCFLLKSIVNVKLDFIKYNLVMENTIIIAYVNK